MPLANYADLLASINSAGGWVHRTDLSAIVPDWVTLCETTINNGDPVGMQVAGLRTSAQETITTLTTTGGNPYVTLPTDFLEHRKLELIYGGSCRREIPIRPTTPISRAEQGAVSSLPEQAVIVGNRLFLTPTPDSAYQLPLWYYARIGPLVTQGSNWLMTAAPNIYLFGSIAHGSPWLGPNFNPAPWVQGFRVAMAGVTRADTRRRFQNATLRCEAADIGGYPFNGLTG